MRNRLTLPFLLLAAVSLLVFSAIPEKFLSGNDSAFLTGSSQLSEEENGPPPEAVSGRAVFSDSGAGYLWKTVSTENPSTPDDPYYPRQWSLINSGLPGLTPQSRKNAPPVVVAILDTGIDKSHEDLAGKVIAEVNLTRSPTVSDIHGHGTHVAGIIGANTGNKTGIAGISPGCRLLNVKVVGDNGRSQAISVAEGILWAVKQGANVINISVAFEEPLDELEKAVNFAWQEGVVVIAAASNERGDIPIYPAGYSNCLSVVATGPDNRIGPLTYHLKWVDLAAPGLLIYSTQPNNSYGYKNGTSFAAAYVTGLAAELFTRLQDISGDGRFNDEVVQALRLRFSIEAGQQD